MRSPNLASRPFRNERLPKLALGLASLLAMLITVYHTRTIVRLLPRSTSNLASEVARLEEEGEKLRADASRYRAAKALPADAAQWSALKDLVDRRVFSWTRLFAVLEEAIPMGVKLVSVSPKVEKGEFVLELTAIARSVEDGLEFLRALEERPEFENVSPRSRTENEEGFDFRYDMKYNPAVAPRPTPAASPRPESEEASPRPAPAAEGQP